MNSPHISILLATYNGAQYLQKQIDSILQQTYTNWTLFFHDDGSTDRTKDIIQQNVSTHSNMKTATFPERNGARDNFLKLLMQTEDNYFMFCDQDDVWLPQKIDLSVKKMIELEKKHPGKPIIVCSDLYVVDNNLEILYESMWKHSGIYPEYIRNFNDSAATAVVTGCTMLINRIAKESCIFPAPKAAMHDSWVCLCALKQNGILYGINRQLVCYRQHEANCLGAGSTDASDVNLPYRFKNFMKLYHHNAEYFKMLKALGYGTVFKYIKYKLKYKQRIRKGSY